MVGCWWSAGRALVVELALLERWQQLALAIWAALVAAAAGWQLALAGWLLQEGTRQAS